MAYKDKETQKIKNREAVRRLRARLAEIEIPPAKWKKERKACERDLLRFIQTFLSDLFPLPFCEAHYEIIATLQDKILNSGLYSLSIARGTGKSVLTRCAVIWGILYGHRKSIIIIQATTINAKESILKLKNDIIEKPDSKLAQAFPKVFTPLNALEGSGRKAQSQTVNGNRTKITYSVDTIIFPTVDKSISSGSTIYATGSTVAIRGKRCDFAILDDLEDQETARNPVSIAKNEDLINKTIAGLPPPGQSLSAVMLSTIQAKGSIADKYTDSNNKVTSAWTKKRYATVQTFPDNMDLWEIYETKRRENPEDANQYYADNREEMDKGASMLWNERYDKNTEISALQSAMNFKIDYGDAFLTELQQQPPDTLEVIADYLSTKDITPKVIGVPKGVIPNSHRHCISVGVDVGKHLLYWSAIAFSRDGSGHVIDYDKVDVPNFPDVAYSIRKALNILYDEVLFNGWKDEDGNTHTPTITMIDSGYMPQVVYAFCSGRYGKMKPCKGHSAYGATQNGILLSRYYLPKDIKTGVLPGDNLYINFTQGSILCHINVDHYKENLIDRWKLDVGTPGTLTLYEAPWGDHLRFASHQCSERLEENLTKSGIRKSWRRVHKGNHHLDSCVLALAGVNALKAGQPIAKTPLIEGNKDETTPANPAAPCPVNPTPRKSPKIQRRIGKVRRIGNASPLPFGNDPICW